MWQVDGLHTCVVLHTHVCLQIQIKLVAMTKLILGSGALTTPKEEES